MLTSWLQGRLSVSFTLLLRVSENVSILKFPHTTVDLCFTLLVWHDKWNVFICEVEFVSMFISHLLLFLENLFSVVFAIFLLDCWSLPYTLIEDLCVLKLSTVTSSSLDLIEVIFALLILFLLGWFWFWFNSIKSFRFAVMLRKGFSTLGLYKSFSIF